MTAQIGNTDNDERGLLPYPVIIAATKGDPEAMNLVVKHCFGLGTRQSRKWVSPLSCLDSLLLGSRLFQRGHRMRSARFLFFCFSPISATSFANCS